jgi:hypothetical protein
MSDNKSIDDILAIIGDRHEIELVRTIDIATNDLLRSSARRRAQYFAALPEDFLVIPADHNQSASDKHNSLLWASEFAIRLASGSKNLVAWAGAGGLLPAGIAYLLELPGLARAARMFVYAVTKASNPVASDSDFSDFWEWQ